MRYEVLSKYEPKPGGANVGIPQGTPLGIRIFPEDKDVKKLFVAMVQSAYEMNGTYGLGGLAVLNEPASISKKEAEKYIDYDSERSLVDRILRRKDNRIPKGVKADYINGSAVKLYIYPSDSVLDAYEMSTIAFCRDVGSIDELFKLTEKNY